MSITWKAAETASFQSFANCYMREIDQGKAINHIVGSKAVDCAEWLLNGDHILLRAEITSPSLCGPQHFGRIWRRALSATAWHELAPMPALQALMREAYRKLNGAGGNALHGCETELLLRVMDSHQQIQVNIEHALTKPEDGDHFIAAEQSLVFGHWLHPTPKSRQGMTFWQQETYAPEFHGRFQLHYFAARTDLVTHASANLRMADRIVADIARSGPNEIRLADGETLLPMHPLQAQALLLDADIQAMVSDGALRSLGPAGPLFTATSSVRTVWSRDADWMLKFSLPVRITNSVRTNGRDELDAGVAMARLVDRLRIDSLLPSFRIIRDPAFITLNIPGRRESGFETILRENPFRTRGGPGIVTLAALTADPLPGRLSRLERIVRQVHVSESGAIASTAATWFRLYLTCAVEPLIALYDRHGIALEAHQQNSLVDLATGYPRLGYYRDNQGFYLSERHRPLIAKAVPETETIGSLYFPEAEIRDRFAYYLIVNQVFSVISRMAHDGLADEMALLRILREHLENLAVSLNGLGRDFIRHILDENDIGTKANLATRLVDVDELSSANGHSLYRKMPNPLNLPALTITETERPHAIAS
ncbi:siderophore synthetase component [Neorhizobium huautlense]|uniref:Siderophore synthetase component n=1 Tax=Neorhizobium huautlense TaxID=67774 RepID=A0ABT9PQ06_9HYPH|nr:IucA/IucC family protein [Neorhizobium huautlense]MDP9836558.1 siderophore synthetase component [Neorhizobium huautlense]